MKKLVLLLTVSMALFLTGCASDKGYIGSSNVGYGEIGSRETLQVEANTEDFKELARVVTDKFLRSRIVRRWQRRKIKPRLIVGDLVNNTDDENIRMQDIYDIIQGQIIESGVARVLDKSSTSFDYILKTELTSTHQYAEGGKELYHLTLKMKLFKITGELVGQWSHEIKKIKNGKRLF